MASTPSTRGTDRTAVRLDPQSPYVRLQSVTIYVRDLDLSLRFYLDQLGFSKAYDSRLDSGVRFVAVTPPDGTASLALSAPRPDSEEYKLIGGSTRVVLISDDVTAKFNEWSNREVRFHSPPQRLNWGGIITTFEDLDGNTFMLVGVDEMSRAIEAQRRAIADKLESERRAAQELEIAKQVQARLFPQTLPRLATLDYAGICIQARKVGGDYYDFLDLGQERLGLVIADIAGKGIGGALLMANLQANLRSQVATVLDQPQHFLRSVNQLFYENTVDNAYATLFFAEYDDRARRLRFANCGHYSALLLRAEDTLERLDSTCTVLGLFKDWDCPMGERRLFPGDTLALYTDGITESFNDAGEEFGEQRLIKALEQNRESPAQGLLSAIVNEVQRFSPQEQQDDVTLIVAKCRVN